jgi:hypothetical protein
VIGGEMLIFGGDRHMISINDVVFLNLEALLNKKDRLEPRGSES